jgi:hypothetical protein
MNRTRESDTGKYWESDTGDVHREPDNPKTAPPELAG